MGYEIGYINENGEINPPIEQGSTFWLEFTVTNIFTDGGATAALTGQYRPSLTGAHVDMVGTILSITPELLSCRISLTAAVTEELTPGSGFWDCELTGIVNDDVSFVLKPLGAANRCLVVGEATE